MPANLGMAIIYTNRYYDNDFIVLKPRQKARQNAKRVRLKDQIVTSLMKIIVFPRSFVQFVSKFRCQKPH